MAPSTDDDVVARTEATHLAAEAAASTRQAIEAELARAHCRCYSTRRRRRACSTGGRSRLACPNRRHPGPVVIASQ
jgi:hypothetical protein